MIAIELTVYAPNPEMALRAMDAVGRCATGLALEGMSATVALEQEEDETVSTEEKVDGE